MPCGAAPVCPVSGEHVYVVSMCMWCACECGEYVNYCAVCKWYICMVINQLEQNVCFHYTQVVGVHVCGDMCVSCFVFVHMHGTAINFGQL